MTGLEALENIGNIDLGDNPYKTFEHNKLKNVYSVDFNLAFKSLKAFEIIKEHIKFEDRGIETYTDDSKNLVTKFMIRLESKDTGATFHIHLDTKEEFDILKAVLE